MDISNFIWPALVATIVIVFISRKVEVMAYVKSGRKRRQAARNSANVGDSNNPKQINWVVSLSLVAAVVFFLFVIYSLDWSNDTRFQWFMSLQPTEKLLFVFVAFVTFGIGGYSASQTGGNGPLYMLNFVVFIAFVWIIHSLFFPDGFFTGSRTDSMETAHITSTKPFVKKVPSGACFFYRDDSPSGKDTVDFKVTGPGHTGFISIEEYRTLKDAGAPPFPWVEQVMLVTRLTLPPSVSHNVKWEFRKAGTCT